MGKGPAFGTILKMGNGTLQVETATVVGTISTAGNATFTITSTGLAGSPLAVSVAVALNDTAAMVAKKAIAALQANAAIAAMFFVGGIGATVTLTRKIATANIANLNVAFTNDTCAGLTPNATSADTTAGGAAEVFTTIASVTNFDGPDLSLDTDDATTHDSTGAWEEVVATILRSGEVSLDLVFDPTAPTQNSSSGLVYKMKNKLLTNFQMIFPDAAATTWSFAAYVDGFKPGAPVAGALTGTAKLKITGLPTLA